MHLSSNLVDYLVRTTTYFFSPPAVTKLHREPSAGALKTKGWKSLRLITEIAVYRSKTVRDRPTVTIDHQQEVIGSRSIGVTTG